MHRIDTATKAAHLFGAGKHGYKDGDKANGIPATDLDAAIFNALQEEIVGVIEGQGIVLEKGDHTQLRQAITQMIQSGQRAVIINNAVFAPAVTGTGKAVYWDSANNRFDLALADGSAKQNMIGFADVANGNVYAFGDAVLFAGLTPGGRYYLDSTTAGAITDTAPPSGVVFVGIARGATEIFVDIDATATGSSGTSAFTAGEDIAARDLVYQDVFNQRGGGATKWYKVDADATAPVRISPRLGIALAAVVTGASGLAQTGAGTVGGFTGLTAGGPVWASPIAGAVTQTAPGIPATGTQVASRMVGYALSATELAFDPARETVFQARNSTLAAGSSMTVEHYTDAGARERIAGAYLATGSAKITGGTAIGNASNLANAFDGNTSQPYNSTAPSVGGAGLLTLQIGKSWGTAKTVTGFKVYPASDYNGFNTAGGSTMTFKLQGSTDNFSASTVDLYTQSGVAASTGNILSVFGGINVSTSYPYHRVVEYEDSPYGPSHSVMASEVEFYEASLEEPVCIGGEGVNGGANDKVTVRFSDAAGTEGDKHTTFFNRTGATRDLVVEVVI